MAFGGSTSANTKPHSHNQSLVNDGGQLSETLTDMNGVTLYSLITDATTEVNTDHVVMDYSTTIGDYSTPTGATCSSAAAGFSAWTRTGTNVSEAGDIISFDIQQRTSNQTISTDLGSTLSDSAWVLRGKLDFTTLANAAAQTVILEIGMGSANHATPIANAGLTLDFIGQQQRLASGGVGWGLVGYNSGDPSVDNPENPVFTSAAVTGTTYYVEMIRLSTTSMSIGLYSDAAFTTLIMPVQTKAISASITNLQYLRIGNVVVGASGAGNQNTGTIQDFQIWDAATTATGDPTYDNGSSCAYTVDDNVSTFWQSTSAANSWIYVDVGSEKDLSQMAIYPNAATTETQYKIQYSNDAVTWTDLRLFNVSALTNAAYNYIRFNTVTARYVRIYGNSGAANVMAINEIKIDETNEVATEHGHLEIDPTDVSLSLDGTAP